jgi:hypothetical protein
MGTANAPEIRTTEFNLSPQDRAEARDSFVRSFERQFADWSEIARVCCQVEQDKDYLLLGFHSFGAWLIEAAPRSRSYIYLVMGRYKELSPDISDAELAEIPLESAGVLKQLSSGVRRQSKVRQQAKGKASDLVVAIQKDFPDQHVEGIVERKLKFTTSQWQRIELAYEIFKVQDESASLETFIEWLVSERF